MEKLRTFLRGQYSRQALIEIFLTCSFPMHIWTLFLVFRDLDWIISRTSFSDALGVASYGLVFALIESLFVALVVVLSGFLISQKWSDSARRAFLAFLFSVLAVWMILVQIYYAFEWSLSESTLVYLASSGHPLRILYGVEFLAVFLTVVLPFGALLFSERFQKVVLGILERISLLALMYLFFDLLALVNVVFRNLLG